MSRVYHVPGLLGNVLSVRALMREGAEVRLEGEGVRIGFSNRQEGVGAWRDGLYILDGTMPLSDAKHETEGEGGVETRLDVRTPHYGIPRVGEDVYSVERGGVTSVGVPEEHGRDSKFGLLELEIKSARDTAYGPLTKGRIERTKVVYVDEGERTHDCMLADDPETLCLGLSRQNESVVLRDGGNTHGHEPRRTHDTQTMNIVAANDLATKIVEKRAKRDGVESPIDLPQLLAPYEASNDSGTAYSTPVDGRMDGDVGVAFGRGHETGEGESGTVNDHADRVDREVSLGRRNYQLAEQTVSRCGHGGVTDSPVVVV